MYAYVVYKDGAKAVMSDRLVRNFCSSSEKDLASGKNKMIYWHEKKDDGGSDLEDYFPGDVVELAGEWRAMCCEAWLFITSGIFLLCLLSLRGFRNIGTW